MNKKYKIKIKETRDIYNLEFPDKEDKLEIREYTFKKKKDYQENVKNLNNKRNYGTHAITSEVIFGVIEKEANLGWTNKCTELEDVLLLLTMFTGRKIFKTNNNIKYNPPVCDHRNHQLGAEIRDIAKKNLKGIMERALEKIKNKEFKENFNDGEFLFLYEQALRVQHLRTSFLTCITIWENIYKIQKNDEGKLRKKFKYISEKYLLTENNSKKIEINNNNKSYSVEFWFEEIRKIRNIATHEMIEKNETIYWERMKKFVKLTTRLIIIILELDTKKRFKNIKELQTFLYDDVDIYSEIKNKEIIFEEKRKYEIKNIKDLFNLHHKVFTEGFIKTESNTKMHLRDIINAMLINKIDIRSENTKDPLERKYLKSIANKNTIEILDTKSKIKEQNLEIKKNTKEKEVQKAIKTLEERTKQGYLGGQALSDYLKKAKRRKVKIFII